MRCGAYIHIPFCSQKCDYCGFHSVTRWSPESQRAIVDKIIHDASSFAAPGREPDSSDNGSDHKRARALPEVDLSTLYVGGGTPSILARGLLEHLVDGVVEVLGTPAEFTCEANPESADSGFLEEAARAGVTRLSLGVQSLSKAECRTIGRRPTSIPELERIRRKWHGALSADLIVGIPGQTTGGLVGSLRSLSAIGFSHISVYDLALEPGTPLARRMDRTGTFPVDTPNWQAVCRTLADLGYERYEVSNFARPGGEAVHNCAYWHSEPYLGLGPAAVSTLPVGGQVIRFEQSSDHEAYLAAHPFADADREALTARTIVTEMLMLGLRTSAGLDRDGFRRRFGQDPAVLLGPSVARLCADGLLTLEPDSLKPTGRGMDALNHVLLELLADLDEVWPDNGICGQGTGREAAAAALAASHRATES